jgi:hypothetical protein
MLSQLRLCFMTINRFWLPQTLRRCHLFELDFGQFSKSRMRGMTQNMRLLGIFGRSGAGSRPYQSFRQYGSGSHLVMLSVAEGTHPRAEQGGAGSPIHCALEHFQPIDLPFGLTVAPWLANRVAHCADIVT